jgi:hypothetical protein
VAESREWANGTVDLPVEWILSDELHELIGESYRGGRGCARNHSDRLAPRPHEQDDREVEHHEIGDGPEAKHPPTRPVQRQQRISGEQRRHCVRGQKPNDWNVQPRPNNERAAELD